MKFREPLLPALLIFFVISCTSQTSNQTATSRPDTTKHLLKPPPAIPPCKEDGSLAITRGGTDTLIVIPVEFAETEATRSLGLMYREAMSDSCGMLFLFEREQPMAFWMHNTILSLDMLFIKADGRIATILEYTTPFDDGRYPASENCQYVLETTAGFSARHGIKVGDKMTFVRR